jgi:hypothetical protein
VVFETNRGEGESAVAVTNNATLESVSLIKLIEYNLIHNKNE